MAAGDTKAFSATVMAKYIPMVAGCMGDNTVNLKTWGILFEPHTEKGVLIVATNGRVLAVVHDESGHCTKAGRITISHEFVRRCSPPEMPTVESEGDFWQADVPDHLMPSQVLVSEICGIVMPKDKDAEFVLYSEGDRSHANTLVPYEYRYFTDWIEWRRVIRPLLKAELSPPTGNQGFSINGDLLASFTAVNAAEDDAGVLSGLQLFPTDGQCGPVIVRAQNVPEFFGMIMPMKPGDIGFLPQWIIETQGRA